VDDGRDILILLQRSEWVDDDLDYDAVMADLADGRSPARAVAHDRRNASFTAKWSAQDRELLNQLVLIARAPYLAMERPDLPSVNLHRLESDFRRTTGRQLVLGLRWEPYPTRSEWLCDVNIDGEAKGAFGVFPADDGRPGEQLARMADSLCEGWLHEEIWGGWPMCPRHGTRPMWAETGSDGEAVWVCEADAAHRALIGELE
jgi:hypothetical protein